MRTQSSRQENTSLHEAYTQSTELIPGDNQQIIAVAASVAGREQNPYTRARLLYNWVVSNINIDESFQAADGIVNAFERKQADSRTAALLYTALVRAAGVPCIPVAGVLIDRNGQTLRHFWAEFWIDNFAGCRQIR